MNMPRQEIVHLHAYSLSEDTCSMGLDQEFYEVEERDIKTTRPQTYTVQHFRGWTRAISTISERRQNERGWSYCYEILLTVMPLSGYRSKTARASKGGQDSATMNMTRAR